MQAGMFAKVFSQIFDSSIAEDHLTRHIFMDLLVLADAEGVVDMTLAAISRRINVPLSEVATAVGKLSSPDRESRSKEEDGRRLVLVDSHRDWGWQIVNYMHYRKTQDEEARRAYFRDYRKAERAAKKVSDVQDVQPSSKPAKKVTHADRDGEEDAEAKPEGSKTKRKKEEASDRGVKFAEWFRTLLPEGQRLLGDWKTSWATTYDELIRLDNRTEKEIADVCKWARQDSFWSSNLLSPVKLRKSDKDGVCYFDRIIAAKNAPPRINGNAPKPKPAPVYEESRMNREVRELMEEEERKQKARLAAEKEKSK